MSKELEDLLADAERLRVYKELQKRIAEREAELKDDMLSLSSKPSFGGQPVTYKGILPSWPTVTMPTISPPPPPTPSHAYTWEELTKMGTVYPEPAALPQVTKMKFAPARKPRKPKVKKETTLINVRGDELKAGDEIWYGRTERGGGAWQRWASDDEGSKVVTLANGQIGLVGQARRDTRFCREYEFKITLREPEFNEYGEVGL